MTRATALVALIGCAPQGEATPGTSAGSSSPVPWADAGWTALPGDPARGEVLFEAECARCHTDGGIRLTECLYEEYEPWRPGDLVGLSLDAIVLQVVFGGDCMPPTSVPLERANGLGDPPMFTRDEVEDVVSYVAHRFARPAEADDAR